MGQLTQQRQVFIGTCGNADHYVSSLAFAPLDTLRELKHLHAGVQHQIAGIGSAMRDGDTVPKISGSLHLTLQHAVHVRRADAAGLGQCGSHLTDGFLFVTRGSTQVNILL
ncbi:hypothetical protein D3C71_1458410 [compost metagenome]